MNAEATSLASAPAAEPRLLGARLSAMMFLQYAVPGLWIPLLGRYLLAPTEAGGMGFSQTHLGWIMGASGTIGALTAPVVGGQLADRHFRTQRIMAVMLIAGGAILWVTSYQTTFAAWLALAVAYSLVWAPTNMLTNSLSFVHLSDPDRQFPRVRVWGTIGWIAVAWTFPALWLLQGVHTEWLPPFLVGQNRPDVTARLADAFKVAGCLAILYGLYCLTLPDTPPHRTARESLAFTKALRMVRRPSFAVLMAAGVAIAAVHQIYFMQTSNFLVEIGLKAGYILPAMSLGQIAEIGAMAALGMALRRLGFKRVMLIGCLAYVARYAIFGTTSLPLWVIIAGQTLHGVCFACFMATAFIYVDRVAERDVRHSAQMVFGLALGCGPILGGWLNGWLAAWFTPDGGKLDYSRYWYTLAGIAVAAMLALAFLFRDESKGSRGTAA
jgi:nucleoside transporter